MGAGRGELRVGPCGTLSRTVPGLAGEVVCERTGPSLYGGSRRIEQEDFPKKKKTLGGTLGNSPAATASVSSPPGHLPVQGLCTPTGECPHLILEGTETTGTGESVNQGRLLMHTHGLE